MTTQIDVAYTSRYQFAQLIEQTNGQLIWSNREPIAKRERDDDIIWTVKEGDRIDNIAYKVYGDPALWWIIADYNVIPLPMRLTSGAVLRMPSKQVVEMEILSK